MSPTDSRRCATCGGTLVRAAAAAAAALPAHARIPALYDVKVRRAPPTETDLGVAMNALQDAIYDAESDRRRALQSSDENGADQHQERADRLRRVYEWLQDVDLD